MNERFEFPPEIDPVLFDRLVDGETNIAEEQSLIGALDARPDGWRRCALAFLEARALRTEISSFTQIRTAAHNGVPVQFAVDRPSATQRAQSSTRRKWPQLLGLAAALMFAFVLGLATRGSLPLFTSSPDERIHQTARHDDSSDSQRADSIQDGWSSGWNYAVNDGSASVTMAVVDGDGNTKRQIEVPLTEADEMDPGWLASRPSAMPQHLVEALRKSGARVDQQRLYVPVMLDDGRQAILPLDQAEVRFPGVPF